jgi:hypothetical protein
MALCRLVRCGSSLEVWRDDNGRINVRFRNLHSKEGSGRVSTLARASADDKRRNERVNAGTDLKPSDNEETREELQDRIRRDA